MSTLSVKLHELLTKLHAGEHAAHDVDEVVKELTAHINESIIPAIENHLQEILPEVARKAIADGLEFERTEAKKIAERLEAVYNKLAAEHGPEAAQALVGAAANGMLDPTSEDPETTPVEPQEHTAA